MASYYSAENTGYTLRLDLTQGVQDVAKNTTTINYALYLVIGAWHFNNFTMEGTSLTINGSKVWDITGSSYSCSGANRTNLLKSGSMTIPHNADGSKSVSFSASFETSAKTSYTPSSALTLSGSFALTTIARASSPRLSATSVSYGSAVTIYTDRATTAFTHTIKAVWNGVTATIATGVGDSYAWTVPLSYMSRIPSSTSTSGRLTLETFSGSTKIGSKSVSLTTNVPSSIIPSISSTSETEAVSGIATAFGGLVQGKSKLAMSMSAAGTYGSTIKSYLISVQGEAYSTASATSGYLKNSGSLTVTYKVTDSRGRSRTTTRSVTVVAYSEPKIKSFSVYRCNSDGSSNPSGTYVRANYNAAVSPVGSKNTKTYSLRYRIGSGSWTTIQLVSDSYTPNTYRVLSGFPAGSSYNFELLISDYFGAASATATVSTSFVTMDFRAGGTGVAIGKISEKNAFEVAMPFDLTGDNVSAGRRFSNRTPDGTDPDTITEEWTLVSPHPNNPTGSGWWYVHTVLYSTDAQRTQIAYQYNGNLMYRRYAFQGVWRAWDHVLSGTSTGVTPRYADQIPSDSDLDGYKLAGFYFNPSDASATTVANTPLNNAFGLIVIKTVGVTQMFYPYHLPGVFYTRRYHNSWSAWETFRSDPGRGVRVDRTVASGISANYTDLGGCFYRQVGKVVTLHVRIKCVAPTTSLVTAFSAPAPADPEYYTSLPVMDNLNGRALGVNIEPDGKVQLRYGDAGRAYYGTITYIAN